MPFNSNTVVIIVNGNVPAVHEISSSHQTTTLYIVWLPYKGQVINLMMAYEKAETCRC